MRKPYILVIDDEPDIRRLMQEVLEDEGYQVRGAENAAQTREALRERRPDLVLLDVWMPDIDGISLYKECFIKQYPGIPVIVMSGHGTVETAVEATRLGAYAFLEKPLSLSKLLPTVAGALEEGRLSTPPPVAQRAIVAPMEPVGRSLAMRQLREQIMRIAPHAGPVLLQGEPGSGKRLLARYLFACGGRHDGALIDVQLAGLPAAQLEALLFGSEASGSVQPGYLEAARGGALYLADLADLPPTMQTRLLSAVQTGSFVRVNGHEAVPLACRLLCGTARDLADEVAQGRFRADLYHLLNAVPVRVPPLRDHREDVPELLNHFTYRWVEEEGLRHRNFTLAAQNRLRNHAWPGNVLELSNLVRRLLMLGTAQEVGLEEVESALAAQPPQMQLYLQEVFDLPLREAREYFEKLYLEFQLRQAEGSVGKVAQRVGLERTHLYRKLRALGIEPRQGK